MNGVDYTRQLARDRDYYRDTVKKTKEASERKLADLESRHEHIQEKQSKNFIEDKAELEKSYQKELNNLSEKTRESIGASKNDYNQKIEEERSRFSKDSYEKRKGFDQKFADIKNSYRRAFESEQDYSKNIQESQKKTYDSSLSNYKSDSESRLKNYQDRMHEAGGSLKEQYNNERQQLVRSHEDQLKSQQKNNSKKNEKLKERISHDIQKTREVAEADAAQAKQYAADSMKNMRNKFEDRYDTMSSDYSQRNKEITTKQQSDNYKTNRQHQEKLENVQRDYNRDLRGLELERRRGDNGSGEFAKTMDQQKGLNDKIQHENQMRSMRSKLVDAQRIYQERAATEQESFNETLKTENTDASVRLERKLNEVNAEKVATIAHDREKNDKKIENIMHKGGEEKLAYERQLMVERNSANERIKKLKENFNKSMVELEGKNKLIVEDVTKTTNKDKAEFVKKINEARNTEVFSMKREFNKMVDSMVEDYEKRISGYQRDIEHLKLLMDQKVSVIADQTQKEVASQRKRFEEHRLAESKTQALANDQRMYQHKVEVNQLNVNFQKKLDKLQVTNDTKLRLLTNDYENKLEELRSSTSKALADKDINQMVEQERLKQAFEAEKLRVVTGYENQISEMKRGHQTQVDQLKEYKRLS